MNMPILSSRSVEAMVQVSPNQTIVIAGLLDQSQHESVEKVPFLGDLPWIGGLFQSHSQKQRSTDLLYKITPQLHGADMALPNTSK